MGHTERVTYAARSGTVLRSRSRDEVVVWRAAVARARSALGKSFEGRMEAALASFDVVPEHGRGAAGRTLADFAAAVGIGYAALDQYRQVMKWLGDFVHVYEISSYSLARLGQVSGCFADGAHFSAFLAENAPPDGLPWTVAALREHLERHPPGDPGGRSESRRRAAGPARAGAEGAPESSTRSSVSSRGIATKAAKRVQGLIAKGISTTYPEEEDVCWKKAAALIRAHGLRVEVSA